MKKYAGFLIGMLLAFQTQVHGQSQVDEAASSRHKARLPLGGAERTEEQTQPIPEEFTTLPFRGFPVAVSRDSKRLAYLPLNNCGINVVNLRTGEETSLNEGVFCAAFSPDGTRLAGMRSGGDVVVWEIDSGKEVATYDADLENFAICLRFIDDQRLAFTAYTKVIVWNLQDDSTHTIEIGKDQTHSVAVSPDGNRLIIGTGWFPLIWPHPSGGGPPKIEPGKAILWDIESGTRLATLSGHRNFGVYSVAFTPDGRGFATAAGDVLMWEARTLVKRRVYACDDGKYVWSMDFSSDGKWLAMAVVWDDRTQLVNLQTGEQKTLSVKGAKTAYVHFLAGDTNQLLTGGFDGAIRLWPVR